MAEQAKNPLDVIKKLKTEVNNTPAGEGFSDFFYFGKGVLTKKVRFIDDLKDAILIKVHMKKLPYNGSRPEYEYNHPCLTLYGKECPTCKIDNRPHEYFNLTLFDYTNEKKPRRIFSERYGKCQPIGDLDTTRKFVKDLSKMDFDFSIINAGTPEKKFELDPIEDSEEFTQDVPKITLEEILENYKKDQFRFILPDGVEFEKLKDLSDEDTMPF
jgi:hypothetical protein